MADTAKKRLENIEKSIQDEGYKEVHINTISSFLALEGIISPAVTKYYLKALVSRGFLKATQNPGVFSVVRKDADTKQLAREDADAAFSSIASAKVGG